MADDANIASVVTVADALGKTLPALSATSDMPVVDKVVETPEPAEVEAPAVTEPENKEAVETESDKTPALDADGKGPEWDKLPAWQKRELTKARNQKRAAEQTAKAMEERTKTAEAQSAAFAAERATALKALEEANARREPPSDLPKPTRDKFDSPESYDAALEAWGKAEGEKSATARAKSEREAAERAVSDEAIAKSNKEAFDTYQGRRLKAMEEIPDYVDVAESEAVTISQPMAAIIMNAENGPEIAYHLGKNPTEADRIGKLSPPMQMFEMGRLAAELARPKPPALTKVPDPITPLSSRNNADRKTLHEIGSEPGNMDEYAATRERQLYPHRFKNGGADAPH